MISLCQSCAAYHAVRSAGPGRRVHASLNLNTTTGRLSCKNPNLQNQPALDKDRYKHVLALTLSTDTRGPSHTPSHTINSTPSQGGAPFLSLSFPHGSLAKDRACCALQ